MTRPTPTPTFPVTQLYKELGQFLQLMGNRSAWATGKVKLAKRAITILYLHTNCKPEEQEQAASLLQSMLSQYTQRAMLLGYEI